jgi:glutaminyl-peptide cyclotransferase
MVFDEKRAFELLLAQVGMGHRYPGSSGHGKLIEFIKEELSPYATQCRTQLFEVPLLGNRVMCQNVLGLVEGTVAAGKKILIGTHFDTRLIADRDPNPEQRKQPILGANDGASGTASMLEIARVLSLKPPPCTVIFAFFDAEDVGDLDGNEFYRGSWFFSHHMGDLVPDEVIILDMVGSRDFCLDIDLNQLYYHHYGLKSLDMILSLIVIARRLSYSQFYRNKKSKFRYIGCDHIPFLQMLIPACIIIDLDYPQWHTQEDLPEFCSPLTLKAVGDVVLEYIYGNAAKLRVGEAK